VRQTGKTAAAIGMAVGLVCGATSAASAARAAIAATVAMTPAAAAAGPGVQGAPAHDQELRAALEEGSRRSGLDLLDDRCLPCLLARWDVYTELAATDEALAAARLAIAIKSSRELHTAAYNRMGFSLQRKGDFTGAEAAYRKAIELAGPERQAALANLAVVAHAQGRDADAAAAARQSLQLPAVGPTLKHPSSLLCNLKEQVAGDDAGEPPLRLGGVEGKPEKLVAPLPRYTEAARKARIMSLHATVTSGQR
jgi:tetratricopeptide (TPR) repeat protein